MKKYVKGHYEKAIFKSNNGYIIGLLKVVETNEEEYIDYIDKTITFTGYFAELKNDDLYIFNGETVDHPKYGKQYLVKESTRVKPTDVEGIVEFLSSDLFKGIGEKQAELIVKTLGVNTLDIILSNKDNLLIVPKMTIKKALVIYETLLKYEQSHKTIVYLTELGFNMKDSLSIYNKYKENTISKIESNIYDLIDEVDGITFLKIDEISSNLSIDKLDSRRIKACIIYLMQKLINESGDTYLLLEEIIEKVQLHIKIDNEIINNYIEELIEESKIFKDNSNYYLKEIYDAEINIINKIRILNNLVTTKYSKLGKYISDLERINHIEYNDSQIEAITSALESNILVITGGPGTGKTTIIKAIVEIYSRINGYNFDETIKHIALLAPTGRASKRMAESTYYPASTIHRFLKWNKDNNEFSVNEYEKDLSDLIIVDEFSMLDINLLDNLFKGLKDNIKFIIVGDYNQLPSVGSGQILKDIIESEIVKVVNLDVLYRQDEESYIPILASEIKKNELSNFEETRSDYTFLKCSSNSIVENLKNLCIKLIEKKYDYKNVQIMAPMYAGINGIDNLNKELQTIFNPYNKLKKELKYGDVIFRENDKILQLVNMPEEGVYNGDVGIIKFILLENESESKKNEIYVDYDGLIVKYIPKDFIKIKHGFVISIHKSQGSEFDFVIMPICHSYNRMLYRKLIYTGITRAKKKLVIIGETDSFIRGINNNNEVIRKTNLASKLKNMYR